MYLGFTMTMFIASGVALLYVALFHHQWCYVALMTVSRDLFALSCYIKILVLTRKFTTRNWSIADIFHETVQRHPDKPCFLIDQETWTFKEVEEYSLRVADVLKAQGLSKDQTIALLVPNCPQFPALWLGIGRFGGIAPLINTNQRGKTLMHSINVANCDAIIFSEEYQNAIQDISSELKPSIKLFRLSHRKLNPSTPSEFTNCGDGVADFTTMLEKSPSPEWSLVENGGFNKKLLYIYTSGTTGLPKAAVISSSRIVFMAAGIQFLGGLNPNDIVYCPLPLYHTAGGVISVGQALIFGCTVALKQRFSASQYFADCVKFKATAAHYIGEMCRYILATAPSSVDKMHSVRVIYGNGMRPQIWKEFVDRFNIKQVSEFYGATEGNANIINCDNQPGAIGFVSRIIPSVYPIAIIKVNQETGEPIRNSYGLCEVAQAHEPGVFIGKISDNPSRAYLGYVDKKASDKKVIRNVFSHGDSAFISGDILVADEFGYLYFKDRTGDTFRWRGENVSTTEVEAAVSRVAGQRDAVVYGVEVPNTEGRAGMCGIVDVDKTLNLDDLVEKLRPDLPAYAMPVFLRVMTSLDMTGTFKMKKNDLQKEGYDPSVIKDKLYYLDLKLGKYLPLGQTEFENINNGRIRL